MDYSELESITHLVEVLVKKGRSATVAALILRLQMDYLQVATLSTDGEYDSKVWTHKDVLDFLTKGGIE